ncbi:MAG: nucleotidyltransferase domain-containing protein [Ignavibacteriae bacterium]|nr:nucleotidyltransferase domain-containing protein [Ignavibacteriota bacterium]
MDKNEVINIIKKYITLLKEHFELERVFLFGSYVNGVAQQHSDIDVAIIVKEVQGDYFTYTPLLWKLRRQVDERIEPILFIGTSDRSGFLSDIMQHGIEVPV